MFFLKWKTNEGVSQPVYRDRNKCAFYWTLWGNDADAGQSFPMQEMRRPTQVLPSCSYI
jgi:hypothetical protein